MAGRRETPSERAEREAATQAENSVPVVVEPEPYVPNPYGRRTNGVTRVPAMVASAARINIKDRRAIESTRRRRQAWQTEAWDYVDEVPEIGFGTDYASNLMGKVRLFPATKPDPQEPPVPVDSPDSEVDAHIASIAVETLERLRSMQGGQSALMRDLTLNFDVAGEALDVETLVATPTGFTPIGELRKGDEVLGGDGRPCHVLKAHPVRIDRDCFEVRLTGGVRIVADAEHLWLTHRQRERQYSRAFGYGYEPSLVTTTQMAETLRTDAAGGKAPNHAIEMGIVIGASPPDRPSPSPGRLRGSRLSMADLERVRAASPEMLTELAAQLHMSVQYLQHIRVGHKMSRTQPVHPMEIDPYILGYWLGDGTGVQGAIAVHTDDQPHLREQVEQAGYGWSPRTSEPRGYCIGILGLQLQLRRLGLFGFKHIPAAYLRAAEQDRWALLQGLIDSDGHINKHGCVEFANFNKRLLWDTAELVSSLGLRPSVHERRLGFNSAGKPVARLPRKVERITPAKERDRWRYVQGVERVKSRPVRCITVDSADGTFLVTPHFVRTHNCFLHGSIEKVGAPDPGDAPDYDTGFEGTDPSLVEDWSIRSVDELVINGEQFQLRRGPGSFLGQALPPDDIVIRLWVRHARFSELAVSPMRRILAEAEAALLLSREIRATSRSRLSNGILLIPSELSFGAIDPTRDLGDGEEAEDPFDAELRESMITPIQEEGSASAVVPIILRGPAELLQHVNHLALDKTLDPVLDARIEQRVLRIARGMNLPVEILTGYMSTTFSNAAAIRRSVWEEHLEPRAVTICDAITSGYFQWALEVAGVPPETAREIFVWFDPSDAILTPDQSEQAGSAHKDMLISDQAYRRYLGYSEDDAPDDDERLLRLVLNAPRMDPTILGQILKRSGLFPDLQVPGPVSGILGVEQSVSVQPTPGAPTAPVPIAASANGKDGHRRWAELGPTLVGIDRDLRARITGKLDQAMHGALEKAGNRIKARVQRDKGGTQSPLRRVADQTPASQVAETLGRQVVAEAGLSDAELIEAAFDQALVDVVTWMDGAYQAALRALERVTGPMAAPQRLELDERHVANVRRARDWLAANLNALASLRLYGSPGAPPPAGEDDGTVLIPANLVRAAVGVAGGEAPQGGDVSLSASAWIDLGGGGSVTSADGTPLGGIGTGPDVMGAVSDAGGQTEAWQWEYGAGVRREFQPHLDLDGVTVAQMSDFEWSGSYDGYPENDTPYPGDHPGCVCDCTPVLVSAEGQTSTEEYVPTEGEAPAPSEEPPAAFADAQGFDAGTGDVTPEDLSAAAAGLFDTRAAIREAGQAIADDHLTLLQYNGVDQYALTRAMKGDADWFDALSRPEQNRIRGNWMAKAGAEGTVSYDEAAQMLAPAFGMVGAHTDDVMRRWVEETRVIQGAQAIANGRTINPVRYGNLELNQIVDSEYDLSKLFAGKDLAVPHKAEVDAGVGTDEAIMALGRPVGGVAPWEMTEAAYVDETARLLDEVAAMRPSGADAWGDPTWSAEDERTRARLRALIPDSVVADEDPENPMKLSEIYAEIIKIARGGRLL